MRNVCKKSSPFPAATTQMFSLPTLFADLLNFFYNWQPLQILPQQSPTSQRSRVLQLGGSICVKMELLISQKLVQVQRKLLHVVDQYLYRMEFLFVLKQPTCNVF